MEELLNKGNVWAVGVGYKKSKGFLKQTKNLLRRLLGKTAYVVYVDEKKPLSDLSEEDIIPKVYSGKETDVVAAKMPEELSVYRAKHRPVKAGVSMCNAHSTACTSGIPVYRDGKTYALVNNHCQGRLGLKYTETTKGDPILQPSLMDGGNMSCQVATVEEWYPREEGKLNEMDAGLNLMSVDMVPETVRLNYIPEVDTVRPGEYVWKEGRTTGYRKAKVLATNVLVRVRSSGGILQYGGMIFTEPVLGAGGDSSSAVFNLKNKVVAQLFAGSDDIMCIQPIQKPLDYFKVSLKPTMATDKYTAIGRVKSWYAIPDEGQEIRFTTDYKLNLRTQPIVAKSTLIKTLPVGTKLTGNYIGKNGGFHWLKVEVN